MKRVKKSVAVLLAILTAVAYMPAMSLPAYAAPDNGSSDNDESKLIYLTSYIQTVDEKSGQVQQKQTTKLTGVVTEKGEHSFTVDDEYKFSDVGVELEFAEGDTLDIEYYESGSDPKGVRAIDYATESASITGIEGRTVTLSSTIANDDADDSEDEGTAPETFVTFAM
ncbi:MAG: hypothetical protein IJV66_04820 [Firmicutes bacterium]|nr:hypothetical protein [Bacillota bacterium]